MAIAPLEFQLAVKPRAHTAQPVGGQDAAQLQNAADVVQKLHEQLREMLDQ